MCVWLIPEEGKSSKAFARLVVALDFILLKKKYLPFLFLCYRHQFYDETLAVFGTSRDRRLPDATGSSLVPAVMQMMVRAADEREFVDFLVAAAAESFRRSVKATLKDVEPGDIDSFVSHVLGASAAIGSCLACESSDRAIWRGACC